MQHLILGCPGMGKTTLGKTLMLELTGPVIIVDQLAEHKGAEIVESLDDLLSLFESGQAHKAGWVVCQHRLHPNDDDQALFEFLVRLTGWTIFVDECDQFCNPQSPGVLRCLMNFRRRYGVNVMLAARRAARIHSDCAALADRIHIFYAHYKRDLEYIRENCGEQFALKAADLDPLDYVTAEFPQRTRPDKPS